MRVVEISNISPCGNGFSEIEKLVLPPSRGFGDFSINGKFKSRQIENKKEAPASSTLCCICKHENSKT